jgi:hypothetical protein
LFRKAFPLLLELGSLLRLSTLERCDIFSLLLLDILGGRDILL